MPTRRTLLTGLAALPLAGIARAVPTDPLFATLDAVGPLEASTFHPGRALDAMRALMAAPDGIEAALRRYLAVRTAPPSGLFVVARCLVEVPAGEHLRPPALGAPYPEPPAPLPRFPAVLLEDVPLSVVFGYQLGGLPEPLSSHLDSLKGATWRTRPLTPSPGAVRALLPHWGLWPRGTPIADALEAQLLRLDPN